MTITYRYAAPRCLLFALATGAAFLGGSQRASALTFNTAFLTNGGGGAFSQADKDCINSVLALYSSTFTDNITVTLQFSNSNSGLGSNGPHFYQDTWANVHQQMILDATTADDASALAQLNALPVTSGNVVFSGANAKALGYSGINDAVDDVINLNASLCFNNHSAAGAAANPSKYDLFGVTCHELDECLGSVSGVTFFANPTVVDLFRYKKANGSLSGRSFNSNTAEDAWFSIDGVNGLDQYNQLGRTNGDWGDWAVHNPYQVQDWAGTPGKIADPNVELRLLDVVGYNRAAVPEPATIAALAFGCAAFVRRRRK